MKVQKIVDLCVDTPSIFPMADDQMSSEKLGAVQHQLISNRNTLSDDERAQMATLGKKTGFKKSIMAAGLGRD